MKRRIFLESVLLALPAAVLLVGSARAQWVEWPVSAGGNGHSYLPVSTSTPISWHQAALAAQQAGGYLATLTSAPENDFVYSLISDPQFWYAGELGPLIGGYQIPGSPEPAQGWTWVTGEPWDYTNWASGQPDNGGQPEEALHFWGGNRWNDQSTNLQFFVGYVVEREGPCTPRKAKATAQVVNGFVVGATITDSGCGYTTPPTLLIKGGGGTGAEAKAIITDGAVTGIQITDAGCCYTSIPQILIGSPPFVPKVHIAVSKVNVIQEVVLGWKYVLETSTNALSWTPTGDPFVADSEWIVREFEVDSPSRQYRLKVVP